MPLFRPPQIGREPPILDQPSDCRTAIFRAMEKALKRYRDRIHKRAEACADSFVAHLDRLQAQEFEFFDRRMVVFELHCLTPLTDFVPIR